MVNGYPAIETNTEETKVIHSLIYRKKGPFTKDVCRKTKSEAIRIYRACHQKMKTVRLLFTISETKCVNQWPIWS